MSHERRVARRQAGLLKKIFKGSSYRVPDAAPPLSFDSAPTPSSPTDLLPGAALPPPTEIAQPDPNAKPLRVFMSSHTEHLIVMRTLPIPPAPAGSGDMGERDYVEPNAYRRERNKKKRARRERRG